MIVLGDNMKKIVVLISLLFLTFGTGCEVMTGDYKKGTYFGYAYDETYDSYATAVIYVDESGMIQSAFIDSTYINKEKSDTTASTKRIEGNDYNMKKYYPSAAGEWYEQAEALEKYIVEHQGLDVTLNEEGKTDAISGATINLTAIQEAVNNALKQAK